jgi:hypothetical protein
MRNQILLAEDLRGLSTALLPACPTKLGSLDPHAVQDHSQLAGERHFGELGSASLGDPHRPATQRLI